MTPKEQLVARGYALKSGPFVETLPGNYGYSYTETTSVQVRGNKGSFRAYLAKEPMLWTVIFKRGDLRIQREALTLAQAEQRVREAVLYEVKLRQAQLDKVRAEVLS